MQTCDEHVAAVALNYNISKRGAAARWDQKRKDGRGCSGGVGVEALGWRLNVDEVKQLDTYSVAGGSRAR